MKNLSLSKKFFAILLGILILSLASLAIIGLILIPIFYFSPSYSSLCNAICIIGFIIPICIYLHASKKINKGDDKLRFKEIASLYPDEDANEIPNLHASIFKY